MRIDIPVRHVDHAADPVRTKVLKRLALFRWSVRLRHVLAGGEERESGKRKHAQIHCKATIANLLTKRKIGRPLSIDRDRLERHASLCFNPSFCEFPAGSSPSSDAPGALGARYRGRHRSRPKPDDLGHPQAAGGQLAPSGSIVSSQPSRDDSAVVPHALPGWRGRETET